MIIKKYLAKTEKDAIEKAKEELGSNAIVMNVKKVHPRGILRIFLRSKVEVTAALDENTSYAEDSQSREKAAPAKPVNSAGARDGRGGGFEATIPPLDSLPPLQGTDRARETGGSNEKQTNEERLSMLFSLLEKQMEETNVSSQPMPKTTPVKPRTESRRTETSAARQEPRKSEPTSHQEARRAETPSRSELHEERHKSVPETELSGEPEENELSHDDEQKEKDKGAVYRDLIYKQLINNEVEESIVDRILDEAKRSLPKDAAVDQILGSVYQRIILMLGRPYLIDYKPNEATKFVFFLGSTGVGKTTTIAKIASRLKLEQNCNLALVTADTYRIAAKDQLLVYADILSVPLHVVYKPEELADLLDELEKYDVVLVDTAGFSHRNKEQIEELSLFLEQVPPAKRLVYLVLSLGTKYKDLKEIAGVYSKLTDYSMIFTKLDETSSAGVMLNMRDSTQFPMSYVTNGQNVPDDIAVVDAQAIAKQLLS